MEARISFFFFFANFYDSYLFNYNIKFKKRSLVIVKLMLIIRKKYQIIILNNNYYNFYHPLGIQNT